MLWLIRASCRCIYDMYLAHDKHFDHHDKHWPPLYSEEARNSWPKLANIDFAAKLANRERGVIESVQSVVQCVLCSLSVPMKGVWKYSRDRNQVCVFALRVSLGVASISNIHSGWFWSGFTVGAATKKKPPYYITLRYAVHKSSSGIGQTTAACIHKRTINANLTQACGQIDHTTGTANDDDLHTALCRGVYLHVSIGGVLRRDSDCLYTINQF